MPGPMLTYTIEKSMHKNYKTGLFLALGHVLFELLIVVLLFIGAGKFFEKDISKMIIGLIGGLILLYFGFGMIKDVYFDRVSIKSEDTGKDKHGSAFFAGIVLSATNPYFLIWWSAVGLTFIISSYNSFGLIGIIFFYLGHILADFSWFIFVAALISKTSHLINIKVYRILIVVLALCLIGFGVKFLLGSIQYI